MLSPKIIIIEDEFFAANHIASLVKSMDFDCVGIYHSGKKFLNETNWDFDLAIVDIFLSVELSGLDVAEHLNKYKKPFIFLTANQDKRTLQEAARLTPKAYITKPFKPNDVLEALETIRFQLPSSIEIQKGRGK